MYIIVIWTLWHWLYMKIRLLQYLVNIDLKINQVYVNAAGLVTILGQSQILIFLPVFQEEKKRYSKFLLNQSTNKTKNTPFTIRTSLRYT